MKMREKVERNEENAYRALLYYRQGGLVDGDDETAIQDLVTDLLHLSVKYGAEPAELVRTALDHYRHESDPANAEEEV